MEARKRVMKGLLLIAMSVVCVASALAQDPPYRPRLLWHLGATGDDIYPLSFTEDGAYLSCGNTSLLQIYRVSDVLSPSVPLGTGLVSYDYSPQGGEFTDKDELGREYVVSFGGNQLRVWRWVRDSLAFRGGYLEAPRVWGLGSGVSSTLVLRGERSDRRYNRLVAIGRTNGNLELRLFDYAGNDQVVVSVGAHRLGVMSLAYDAGSRRLVSGGADGLIRIWQVGFDGNGAPTLAPVQTVVSPLGGSVEGLAFGTVGTTRYLVANATGDSSDGYRMVVLAGWQWGSALSSVPLWTNELAYPAYYVDMVSLYALSPYGDLEFVGCGAKRGWPLIYSYLNYLVNVATGRLEYGMLQLLPIISPPINGERYVAQANWRPVGYYGMGGTAGLQRYRLERMQEIDVYSQPATAIGSIVAGTTRYVVVGYADGRLRTFTRAGSGSWSRVVDNAFHSVRVVGVGVLNVSGTVYSVSVDVDGNLRVVRHGSSPATVGLQSIGWTVTSMDVGRDSGNQTVIAIGGHNGSVPQVAVYRLGWSGGSAVLTLVGSLTLSEDGFVSGVRFVGSGSLDLVVSSGSRSARWNWTGSGYALGFQFGDDNSTPRYARVGIGGDKAWFGTDSSWTPSVWQMSDGALYDDRLKTFLNSDIFETLESRVGALRGINADEAVWGTELTRSQGDIGRYASDILVRGRLIATSAGVVREMTLLGMLPDAALDVSVDTADDRYQYVACANGRVVQMVLPRWEFKELGYAGFSGVQFDTYLNKIGTFFTRFVPTGSTWWRGDSVFVAGTRSVGTIDLLTGSVLVSSPLSGWALNSGRSTATQLTPSGAREYGYELDSWRLTAWDGSTMGLLFNSASYQAHWYLLAADDSRMGLLHYRVVRNVVVGSTTYSVVVPVMRFINWTTNGVEERVFTESEARYIVAPTVVYPVLQSYRWDIDGSRRIVVLYGLHNTSSNNDPNQNYRKVWLLYRPNASSWSNWVIQDSLESSDFPPGVYPTMVKFHPYAPNALFVGLSNGVLRRYNLDATGHITNRSNPIEMVPTLGSLGAVSVLDIGDFTVNGYHNTVMVFGGAEGLSVWVGNICQPSYLEEIYFYQTDIAFFPSLGGGYINISQPDASSDPYLVYSNGWVVSCAVLSNLPPLPCPEDVNRDGTVDDSDVLQVLFDFGGVGFSLSDVNCDGLVDDSDLLLVLFKFGSSC